MKDRTSIVVLTLGLAFACAAQASAQITPDLTKFVDVNVGGQPQERTFTTSSTFPIYGETATVATAQRTNAGVLFDVRGGVRVWNNFAVGIGFSTFGRKGDAAGSARIPDPGVFGRPASVTLQSTGLERKEIGTHPMLVWYIPVTDKVDVAVSFGPSFIHVKQDVLSVNGVMPGTQIPTTIVSSESKTAVGGHVGIDGNYLFTPRFGGGIFVRYAGASADLPSVSGLHVGGFQAGIGLRVRF
jgi:hypothetical protein